MRYYAEDWVIGLKRLVRTPEGRCFDYCFKGGPEPLCVAACDANGDGLFCGTVSDPVYLLQYNFLGGIAPPTPFPTCGLAPKVDVLTCGSYPSCE